MCFFLRNQQHQNIWHIFVCVCVSEADIEVSASHIADDDVAIATSVADVDEDFIEFQREASLPLVPVARQPVLARQPIAAKANRNLHGFGAAGNGLSSFPVTFRLCLFVAFVFVWPCVLVLL